ncbi:Cadmium/zinc-transporting ATPase HMA2 [Acorus calamus]|uniref:Cadmium/zinc-transporting ATPase HMA2 n=1 Tax=Acorus calamus TaxID=4465 RepID=A0AAV9ET62_ACOCL|nr:Cadmium/zinc-transporting ATPase HMA2 [Acorus calamus]
MGSTDVTKTMKFQKSYFDVLGLCCTAEVPLIEKILKPLEGIKKVSVIVPSKTVIVVHDSLLISQLQIVKVLNQARLEANIRIYGDKIARRSWPSRYTIMSGVLLLLSFVKFAYPPFHWLALAAVVVGLPPILVRSIAALRISLVPEINTLLIIAVGGAIALKDYLEAGSIVFLFTIAEWLESQASSKATSVMSSLLSMAPQKAILADTGVAVDACEVKPNTIIAVKAGEAIPIDGVVIDGSSEVDERTLTGEPVPVLKEPLSLVWAGTINLNGYITVRTTALAEDSAVARMAKLVEEAQNNKSRTQRIIDTIAKFYTPVIILMSILTVAISAARHAHNLHHWFHLSLVLLVSACPCALVLSTPIATFCALNRAATMGLLIKGGDHLETLAKTNVVAFDKTGTITRGEFTVTHFSPIDDDSSGISLATLLYWVASVESKSNHPMASALVDHARLNSMEPAPEKVDGFRIFPGQGISGEMDGETIYVGNKRIATRAGCESVPSLQEAKEGETIGYIFMDRKPVGVFSLADTCRTGVAEAIGRLKRQGIKTIMLTGDSSAAAMHVQNQLGHALDTIHAELLPEEKVRIIDGLKKPNRKPTVVMVGDGMNDAPALAAADVGISMGLSGSAVAMETGHATLMTNDIGKIAEAVALARRTRWKIFENVGLAISTKAGIVALAIAGHPLLWAAVLADVGTCLIVIFNSTLLLWTGGVGKRCCESAHASAHESEGTCAHSCHGAHEHAHGAHEHGACLENGCHAHCARARGEEEGREGQRRGCGKDKEMVCLTEIVAE